MLKNKILLVPIALIDIGATWFADALFPDSDEMYWDVYFTSKAIEIYLISFFVLKNTEKNTFLHWFICTWSTLCCADVIDNIIGLRDQITIFDWIALWSSLLNGLSFLIKYKKTIP